MKLIVATVQEQDADRVIAALTAQAYRATRIGSTGGFLQEGNTTLLMGVEDDQVAPIIEGLARNGQKRMRFMPVASGAGISGVMMYNYVEVQIGGATAFVLDVEHFEQI